MTAKEYRLQARQALSGNWAIAAGTTLVATLLGGATYSVVNFKFQVNETQTVPMTPEQQEALAQYLPYIIGGCIAVFLIIFAISTFVSSVVSVGYFQFVLNMIDGKVPEFKDLFSRFRKSNYWNTVVLCFLQGIYILGWTLLFIIPGIIASYSYTMAPYVMLDHPELTPSQCLKVSKRMMEGNRWRLFCLEFSFIGWSILSDFTFGIGNLFLTPYRHSAHAAFYQSICNDVVIDECI